MDQSFIPFFLSGDLATQKLYALIAAMAYDTLFFDFVYEVIREKMIVGSNELTDSDVRVFFKDSKTKKWPDGQSQPWFAWGVVIKRCSTKPG